MERQKLDCPYCGKKIDVRIENADQANFNIVYKVSLAANKEIYKKLREEVEDKDYMNSVAREVYFDLFEEERIAGQKEACIKVINRMLRANEPVEKIMEYTKAPEDMISRIANSMGI